MSARTFDRILASLVAWLSLLASGCDTVRPGDYGGSFPGPLKVEIPQTPDFQTVAAQAAANGLASMSVNPVLSVYLRTWILTSARAWSSPGWVFAGGGGFDHGALPARLDVSVWPALAGALDIHILDLPHEPILAAGIIEVSTMSTPGVSPDLVAADVNHVFFAATEDASVEPIGPAGPVLSITRGFHAFERACTPDGQLTFTEVPLDIVAPTTQLGYVDWNATPPDPFVAACGVDTTAPIDLGAVAAAIPAEPVPPNQPTSLSGTLMTVPGFAWTPTSDGIYFLAEGPGNSNVSVLPSVQLRHLTPGESTTTLVTVDDLAPPLTMATGGASVLVWRQAAKNWDYIRLSLTTALSPLQVSLSDPDNHGPTGASDSALSADGNFLASTSIAGGNWSTGIAFVDLRTGATSTLALPAPYSPQLLPPYLAPSGSFIFPRAWDPTGVTLLVEIWSTSDPGSHTFATMALDIAGALPTVLGTPVPLPTAALPAALASGRAAAGDVPPDTATRYFWSASGPEVLVQDAEGARVYNFATQQTIPLVEPTLVATADTGMDVVAAPEQAFAWAVQCFGFAETSCRAQLRRLTLATGAVDVVATAERARPFAVSPDGKQIVLADDTSIYLKTVGP